MRSSDTLPRCAAEEVGIALAPDHASGIPVDRILRINIPEVAHGEEARDIGVIHEAAVPKPVHLIGVHLAEGRVRDHRILPQRSLHLVCQLLQLSGKILISISGAEKRGCLTAGGDGKEIRGDEELVVRRIVRGAEGGDDQPDRIDRFAPAVA